MRQFSGRISQYRRPGTDFGTDFCVQLLSLKSSLGVLAVVSQLLWGIGVGAQPRIGELEASRPISAIGVVVGDSNEPLEGATVRFEARRPSGSDVFPSFVTDHNGVFQLDDAVQGEYAYLVVERQVPGIIRVAVDYRDLKRFREFRGMKLKVPDKPVSYQLEYIRPHITYRKVELDLTPLFKGNRLKSSYVLQYSVRYKGVLIIDRIHVDSRDFDPTTKKLNWVMPVGDWNVTIRLVMAGNERVAEYSVSVS